MAPQGVSQACQDDRGEVVKLLLEDWRICTTTRETDTGCTPLWNAAHFGELGIVEQLLASEREIDTTTRSIEGDEAWNGTTPGEIAGSGDYNHDVFTVSETEDISRRRQRTGRLIQQLIDAHERDPRRVRHQLREKPEYRGSWVLSLHFFNSRNLTILLFSSSFLVRLFHQRSLCVGRLLLR